MLRNIVLLLAASLFTIGAAAQKNYDVLSPDGNLKAEVSVADGKITYSVEKNQVQILVPSEIAMTLADGTAYDGAVKLQK